MAEVFLARLPGVGGFRKTVVIKRILPHLARKRRFMDMFVAEASLAAEVRHRNVVQVYELGRVGDELYMAMEYVKGTDLRVLLGQAAKRGLRIPPWFSVHVVCEVLEALAFAWNLMDDAGRPRQIVHRDVTPSNIFISDQGEIKLGDFGVARDATQERSTRAGQLKGKLAYMSPEQLYSKPPDHRVDVFAAGVVLWESLAQRRLFGGRPEIEVMKAITQGARRPPSEHVADIPAHIDAVVLSAVEIDKGARLESAEAFQHYLLEVLPSLRAQVRPSDIRTVVEGLLGHRAPEVAGLEPLADVRTGAKVPPPRTATQESFTPYSEYSDDPHREPPLVDPLYDDEAKTPGPTYDLVGDLGLESLVQGRPSSGTFVLRSSMQSSVGAGDEVGTDDLTAIERRSPSADVPVVPVAPATSADFLSPPDNRMPVEPTEAVGTVIRPRRDFDMEALVSDAVSSVEDAGPKSSLIPKDHMLAGLEHRRILDNSRQLKSERWSFILDQELYEGDYPFWIKDHEGTEVGPCSLEQAIQIIKVECQTDLAASANLSTSRGSWFPMLSFLKMAGMDALAGGEPPELSERPSWSGTSDEHTLASVLTALTRARANGRLIIEAEASDVDGLRIIEVAQGRPTYVWAPGEAMQIPQLLVSKRVIHPTTLPQVLHDVLARRIPLGRVVSVTAGVDIRRYFPMLMKERMAALFTGGFSRFSFDANHRPESGEPFAKTLMSPVSELTFRLVSADRIQARLMPVLNSALEPVRDFTDMVDALGFKPEHIQVAERLARGKRISKLLESVSEGQARLVRTIAYILVETELLRPT